MRRGGGGEQHDTAHCLSASPTPSLATPAPLTPAVLQKLSADVKRSMELPETKQRADAAGIEVRYLSPADTNKVLERETADWSKAIKAANIKID